MYIRQNLKLHEYLLATSTAEELQVFLQSLPSTNEREASQQIIDFANKNNITMGR